MCLFHIYLGLLCISTSCDDILGLFILLILLYTLYQFPPMVNKSALDLNITIIFCTYATKK